MITTVDWESAHLFGGAWISHHRLRHRVFVQRLAWHISAHCGLEYDQFDTPAAKYLLWLDEHSEARGAVRLIPTTVPYMTEVLWPDLVPGDLPKAATVWEATRFVCDHSLTGLMRRSVIAELICGCQEFGLLRGIQRYLSVMPEALRRILVRTGCIVDVLGASRSISCERLAAGYVHVSVETLHEVRMRTGLTGPVLRQSDRLAA